MNSPENRTDPIVGVLPGVVLFIAIGVLMLLLLSNTPTVEPQPATAEVSIAEVTQEAQAAEATAEATAAATEEGGPAYDPSLVNTGETVFMSTCVACHGMDARGIPGLGKDLLQSQFLNGLDEAGFIQFVNRGRDITDPLNTTGVMMPPKGGNPTLTDQDLAAVWAYLRANAIPMEETTATAEPTATEEATTTEEPTATTEALAATTDSALGYDPSLISTGETAFMSTCVACHGMDARGIPGLGKNLIESEFLDGLDQAGFIEFVNRGRDITDPLNTTGVMMPPKGGNPTLTDQDLAAIWAFLRSKAETAG